MDFNFNFGKKLGSGSFSNVWIDSNEHVLKIYKFINNKEGISCDCIKDIACFNAIKILEIKDLCLINVRTKYGRKSSLCLITENGGENLENLYKYNLNFSHNINNKIFNIFKDITQTLIYQNDLGIIHRDIKPLNILLSNDNKTRLIDYGLASLSSPNHGEILYTSYYRPPECNDYDIHDVTIKSDIWVFGASMFEFITGKTLIKHETIRKPYFIDLNKVLNKNYKDTYFYPLFDYINGISTDLCDLIKNMLQIDPKKRASLDDIQNSNYFKNIIWNNMPSENINLNFYDETIIKKIINKFKIIDEEFNDFITSITNNDNDYTEKIKYYERLLIDIIYNILYMLNNLTNNYKQKHEIFFDTVFYLNMNLFHDNYIEINPEPININDELELIKDLNYKLIYWSNFNDKKKFIMNDKEFIIFLGSNI